jgi:hypothetical protein
MHKLTVEISINDADTIAKALFGANLKKVIVIIRLAPIRTAVANLQFFAPKGHVPNRQQ